MANRGWRGAVHLKPLWSILALLCLVLIRVAPLSSAQTPGTVNTNLLSLFTAGEDGYYFRIPSLITCADGALLAFAEGRPPGTPDFGDIDIVMKRSTNNGTTWQPLQVVGQYSQVIQDGQDLTIQNPTAVLDQRTGRVYLLAQTADTNETAIDQGFGSRRVWVTQTADDGQTWSTWREITAAVKPAGWRWFVTGPGHGIQLQNGIHAGRLVVPIDYTAPLGTNNLLYSAGCIYSDDGTNWQLGAVDGNTNGLFSANETCLVELAPGTNGNSLIYLNSRRESGSQPSFRGATFSADGAQTFTGPFNATYDFTAPACEASLLRFSYPGTNGSGGRILFSAPNQCNIREWVSISVSRNEGVSWDPPRRVCEGPSAYSDMALTGGGAAVGILYESTYGNILFQNFSAAWLDAPPSPADLPNQGRWTFMEGSPGQTTVSNVTSVLDTSPAGYGLDLTPDGSFTYLAGPTNYSASSALHFNGTGGLWLTGAASGTPFQFYSNDSFTVETMVRIPTNVTQGALVARDFFSYTPEWWLAVQNGGYVCLQLVDSAGIPESIQSAQRINDGTWHEVAAVRDATARQLRLYVDGVLTAQAADVTIGSFASGRELAIGRLTLDSQWNLIGDMDYVQITPAALGPGSFLAWPLTLVPPVAGPAVVQRFASGGIAISTTTLLTNDTDVYDYPLTVTGVSSNSAAGGTVALVGSTIYYAPPAGSTNGDTFTYTLSDGHNGSALGAVTVLVEPDCLQPYNVAVANPAGGPTQLTFSGIPGYQYVVQYKNRLTDPNWQTLTNATADVFGRCVCLDPSPTNRPSRFYRLSTGTP